jgi:signal transduction histidine kinase
VEVAASRRRLVNAALEERRELAIQVDSDVQVPLAALASRLAAIDGEGPVLDAPGDITRAADLLEVARDEIRDLASGLFPRTLTTDGLATALHDLSGRSTVPVDVEVRGNGSAGAEVDATIYFVCAETLANAARHAHASRIVLRVTSDPDSVTAVIEDDGVGGAELDAGTGLRGLRDRVEALDGTLDLASEPGMGTRLTVTIPVSRKARPA